MKIITYRTERNESLRYYMAESNRMLFTTDLMYNRTSEWFIVSFN